MKDFPEKRVMHHDVNLAYLCMNNCIDHIVYLNLLTIWYKCKIHSWMNYIEGFTYTDLLRTSDGQNIILLMFHPNFRTIYIIYICIIFPYYMNKVNWNKTEHNENNKIHSSTFINWQYNDIIPYDNDCTNNLTRRLLLIWYALCKKKFRKRAIRLSRFHIWLIINMKTLSWVIQNWTFKAENFILILSYTLY